MHQLSAGNMWGPFDITKVKKLTCNPDMFFVLLQVIPIASADAKVGIN